MQDAKVAVELNRNISNTPKIKQALSSYSQRCTCAALHYLVLQSPRAVPVAMANKIPSHVVPIAKVPIPPLLLDKADRYLRPSGLILLTDLNLLV